MCNLSEKLPYKEGSSGKCPHCRCTVFFDEPKKICMHGSLSHPTYLITASEKEKERVSVYSSQCPNCKKPIVVADIMIGEEPTFRLIHPFNVARTVPPEVPKEIQEDFLEAAAVLSISEKASAALSRRCLQNLLTDKGYKRGNLNQQVDKALKDLSQRIGENLDVVRNIGNFAAHPMKYKKTGLIVDLEPEEASWTLDVLEELFEYYYVQPKRAEKKRNKLEKKLQGLGKPPLKKPSSA